MQEFYWWFLSFQGLEWSITDRNWMELHALDFSNGQVDTFSLIFGEPLVKTLCTRVVPMNPSLMWILSGVRQPNYSYLPSDLSHMGSNQRSNLWLQWCNQAQFSEIDGLMNLCIENWWTQAFCMLSRINGLTTIMLWKSMASSKLCSESL